MQIRLAIPAVAGLLTLGALTPAKAQMVIPDKFENLQVLPKDIPKDTLVQIMRGFAMSLGTRCQFCHVEGAGPGQFDFKADDKDHKRIARIMLRMTDSVNKVFLASIPNRDNPATNVNCYTCHRGMTKPSTIETMLTNTTARFGVDTAIARYKNLRNDMTSGRYNFGEQPVTETANKMRAAGKYDDAIKLLMMNQEFYPNSPQIDFEIAETLIAKGDKDGGIARLRAMLAKNPNDRRAAGRLRQLGVEP